MLCRQKCWCADNVLQELDAQILQVGVPLKVLPHTFATEPRVLKHLAVLGHPVPEHGEDSHSGRA